MLGQWSSSLPTQTNNNNNNHHTPPPLNCCSAVLAWLDWPPLVLSFICGITQKDLFIITTITCKSSVWTWHPIHWSKWAKPSPQFTQSPSIFIHFVDIQTMPHLLMQSYLFTSLGQHICHITDHVHMYMCEYGPIKYEPSCMTPDVALELKFILALKPVPYQLVMACTTFVLVLTVLHMPHHQSLLSVFVQAQFHPSTTTSNSLFTALIHICFQCHTII